MVITKNDYHNYFELSLVGVKFFMYSKQSFCRFKSFDKQKPHNKIRITFFEYRFYGDKMLSRE